MPSKKLLTLLGVFSGSDISRFKKYLCSPFFNENEDLIKLFDLLEKQKSSAAKEKLWQALFGEKSYNDGYMRRLLSDLIQLALDFLSLKASQKEGRRAQIALLSTLSELKLDTHFAGVLRQMEAAAQQSTFRDSAFYFWQYEIEHLQHQRMERSGYKLENLSNLENADHFLDCYYIIQKLRHCCDVLEYRNFFSLDIQVELLPGFITWFSQRKYLKEPGIAVYFDIYQMLSHQDGAFYYYKLKTFLEQHSHYFTDEELRSLYVHLINYCIYKKINIGDISFFKELFDVFKTLIQKEILLRSGVLDPQYYKTIISVGIQIKEFDWVEHFIQSYTAKLPPEEQENALAYNLAKLYFQQKRYHQVITQLREVEYQNVTYALGAKLMLLKTYYALNEYLALDSLIDSFRIYLHRNKTISKEVRQQYMNVLRFIKKLANITPGDRSAVEKISLQIDACKNLADKSWILEKVAALKGDKETGQ